MGMELGISYKKKETRQALYVYCNNEARSCNHCCSAKTIF